MFTKIEGLNKWERIKEIEGNSIPDMIVEDNDNSFWNINVFELTKQEFLERIMSYIPTYKFDTRKFKLIDDSTYELFTTDGKKITLKIHSQGKNILDTRRTGTISLIDGNIENIYLIVTEELGKKLFIELIKTIEMDTGIEKEYDDNSNTFTKPIIGNRKISIKIGTYRTDEEDGYVIEDLEKYFKRKTFEDVMDGYHFVMNHVPILYYRHFTIQTFCNGEEEDCIEIKDGFVKKIAITKQFRGKSIRITDEFQRPLDNEAIMNILTELHGLREKEAEMVRQMKKWIDQGE